MRTVVNWPTHAHVRLMAIVFLTMLCVTNIGCGNKEQPGAAVGTASSETEDTSSKPNSPSSSADSTPSEPSVPTEVILDADKLMDQRLAPEQLAEGWVRLFDGQSLFGWFSAGKANWHVADGEIRVSDGEVSFLCTSFQISDFELLVDFKCPTETNSGVFLRTSPQPEDVASSCLELNIAPPDNPFPTGSFVQRQKLEPSDLGEIDADQWHTYHVRVEGSTASVKLDGRQIMQLSDFSAEERGHVSLQHNSGKIAFRNILMRPIYPKPLDTGPSWETDWEKSVKEGASMDVQTSENGLTLKGGLGQLQSKADFDDFWLTARYSLANRDVNSGIFFRCVRDAMLDGYECQVNHSIKNDDPVQPGDAGAGAIFRRQNARAVIGDGTNSTTISVLASGNQICTWVDGIQVVDFVDARKPDENPRRGRRDEAGPISLQAHDPGTEVTFHQIDVSSLASDLD